MSQSKQQANQYDKIIKENLESTLPVIVREVLGLDIVRSEELPDDVQHTKERKPDALKKVTDSVGNTFILHLEFQVKDEKEMVYRMAEYSIMLLRKYKLPVQQYVIFLRDIKPSMAVHIDTNNHKYHYNLVCISQTSYKLFLKSDNPEVKMLGILGSFDGEDSYAVVEKILKQVRAITEGDFAQSRYFKQLRIFVQLRSSFKQQFDKVMETISRFFKEEKDFLYRKGEAKGEARKSYDVVENLIVDFGFTDEQAAKAAEVSIDFVQKVRADLAKKKN